MAQILIAEDDQDILELLEITLNYGWHSVVAVSDGEELLEKLNTVSPDLILMDVKMPVMSGIDACLRLKANPATKNIPIVFLSAKGQEAEIKAGLDAGADAYLLKPFDPPDLIRNISIFLEK